MDERFKLQVNKWREERKSGPPPPGQLGIFTEKMTLQLDKELKEELRRLAAKKVRTVSGFLREFLRKHLKDKYRLLKAGKGVTNVTASGKQIKKEVVSVIVDSDMKRKLEKLAARKRGSISAVVGELLRDYLKNK